MNFPKEQTSFSDIRAKKQDFNIESKIQFSCECTNLYFIKVFIISVL